VDEGVQKQARERYATLTARLADRSTSDIDLSVAFGELGMVLQAAEFHDVAEPCYLNAQTLAPTDLRWPYYLAGLYKSKGDSDKAEAAYKRALELRPDDLATLVWLGRLELDQGRPDAAEPLFTKALTEAPRTVAALAGLVRLAPADAIDESAAKAHYSLGVMREEKGQHADALAHLDAAVKYQPNDVEAHLALADALRRGGGRMQAALTHYQEALSINPRSTAARLGVALAMVGLGRYEEATDWLADAMKRNPERPESAQAAARLLAAAPDARVRDGRTALAIAQKVFEQQKSTDVDEAMAMARAEMGDFDEAVRIQRDIMAAAEKAARDGGETHG
jgi:tetratricopeptide (TPR) repeat protein